MKNDKRVFALGFFDGVHLGHQALLRECVRLSEELDCRAAAITFDTHPQALTTGQAPGLLNTGADRLRLLRCFGIGPVFTFYFNHETRNMPWQDFFRELLSYGAAGFVCGQDFRFGYRGEGNAEKLAAACTEMGIPCVVVPDQCLDGVRISSTHIRQLMESGEMETANRFLGHPHILTGTVVSGRRLGRTLGVPTANLHLPEGVLAPKFGVYACRVTVGEKNYAAVANVGTRPTVSGSHITVEPWILDFEGDLYGKEITLEFYRFLRPETKFESLEELRQQIRRDAEETRNFFGKEE